MPILASINECTGCLVCVDSCPVGALEATMSDEYYLTYALDSNKCISCGCCEKSCPVVSNYSYGCNNLKLSTLYAGWTSDSNLRKKSSSGGIFAALAKTVISVNGIAIGASMKGYKVFHCSVAKGEDLSLLQGSKYAQSNTTGIYKVVRDHLKSGKTIVFSGLGCQVAGLLSFLGDKFDKSNLLTVDIICGGVPSYFLLEQFAAKYFKEYLSVNSFRNKQLYEFSVCDKEGKIKVITLIEKTLPLCGFYTEKTNRMSCYDCKFAFAHRKSDVTIGDFWGDTSFIEQHKDGISAVVVHSKKGRDWLEKSEIELHEGDWKTFLFHNHRMVDGKNVLGQCRERRNLSYAIKYYDYDQFLIDYANYATWKKPYTWVLKIWRYLRMCNRPTFDKEKVISILKQK